MLISWFLYCTINFIKHNQLGKLSEGYTGLIFVTSCSFRNYFAIKIKGKCIIERKKVKSLSRVQLFVTPWTVAYQVPLSMGFSRQEYWSGLPFPSPGDLPDPGIEPRSPTSEALPSELPVENMYCQDRRRSWYLCRYTKRN